MADWLAELRYVVRGCLRAPWVSLTIVATLVLGLGLASAIFAFADGYLFRPPAGSDRTYFVETGPGKWLKQSDTLALRRTAVADLGLVEWTVSHRIQEDKLSLGDRTVEFFVQDVTPGFSKAVRLLPLVAGRDFTAEDHLAQDPVPVWISYKFWTRELHGDRGALGRTFTFRAYRPQSVMVVGILAPDVSTIDDGNRPPEAIAPALPAQPDPNRTSHPLIRLPDGMTVEQATAQIASALQVVAPASDGQPRTVRLKSFAEAQLSGGRPTARVLFAGAMLVLLLAAINLVHLLLSRGVARSPEVATRTALGASRWRITRLFLTESLLLGSIGLAGGLAAGRALTSVMDSHMPQWPTSGRNIALVPMLFDWRVVAFAAVIGFTIAAAGGLWPARRASAHSLASGSRSRSRLASAIPARLSSSILASQLAVATVVMVGTCFIGLGTWRYLHQPLGFDIDGRFHVTVYKSDGSTLAPQEIPIEREALLSVPGVRAVGPLRLLSARGVSVPGRAIDDRQITGVSAPVGYFETLNLRLRGGRWFTAAEFAVGEPVAVVDEGTAHLAWPDGSPLGQEISVAGVMRRVVGVIQPIRISLQREGPGFVYVPKSASDSEAMLPGIFAPGLSAPELERRIRPVLAKAIAGATAEVEPISLETYFLREVGEARFQAPILLAFGTLAFALAAIGVFGLVSYLVAQRTREFAIRLALGAQPAQVWRSVIRGSIVPAVAGLSVGIGAAWALESVVRANMFGWPSSGPIALASVAPALLLVAVVAAIVPANRAMRADPVTVLRAE
ncbi:MAG TPA: ABC transporter permease [Vicinamibacterales bacterium]|nr:ABC transporter permease [Vicinamibacterales bacterium]